MHVPGKFSLKFAADLMNFKRELEPSRESEDVCIFGS
jgi:hypothetical protein